MASGAVPDRPRARAAPDRCRSAPVPLRDPLAGLVTHHSHQVARSVAHHAVQGAARRLPRHLHLSLLLFHRHLHHPGHLATRGD
eukprot:178729-Prymnesium_polylepis.1